MFALIKKLLDNDKIRYIIAGGCTTFVNLITFFVLRSFTSIDRNLCNVIAISVAITFAYFAAKYFVFRSKTKGVYKTLSEALTFLGARLVSMVVEVLGFAILCDSFRMGEVLSKVLVQIVVLVLNYVFSNVFVFNKERKSFKQSMESNYCYYLSFFIVAVLMLAVCISLKIVPFGNNALTLVDSMHQYVPFFSEYRYKLLNEGSLFYSWDVAMGSNFISLAAYYLNSPMNYIILLFNKENIVFGMCFLTVLKICLSSTTMVYYLSHKEGGKPRKDIYIVAIAVAYALSNYVISFNWCLMWMDCIMMLPLVVLGFERLMRDKDPKLYVISLFYCLYCNYYIGFMVCVFMVLWFFVYNHKKIKDLFANGLRFALYSLVSGGLAMFSLIPAYFGIMSTKAGEMQLPKWEWYGDIFVLLKQQFFFTLPITNQTFDGGVNLYCGMFAVFAMFLYIFTINRKPVEHIKKILLLVFLVISFNNVLPNYIWHGFHDQYGIPNRFSFLFIFVILGIAYDELRNLKDTKPYKIIFAGGLSVIYVAYTKYHMGESVTNFIAVVSIILLTFYTVWCAFGASKMLNKYVFSIILTSVFCIEIVANAAYGFEDNGISNIDNKFSTTPQVTDAYKEVQAMAKEDNVGFYRAELVDSTVLNEVTWHNMPSVGTFCSTVLGEMVTTMGRLGFYTGANEFLYMGSTPFTNSILNVRYLLDREGDYNNFDFDYVKEVEGVGIYENPYPLSIGFAVNDEVLNWDRHAWRAMVGQENLAMCMVGQGNFFDAMSLDLQTDTDNGYLSANVSGYMSFKPETSGPTSIMASFYVETPGDYYLNCRGNYVTEITFFLNGEEITRDRYQSQIFHLGELEEGDYVSVEYYFRNVTADTQYSPSLTASIYREDVYQQVYSKLSLNQLNVTEFDDGYVLGEIDMPKDQIMFTSIPYDEGWDVYVDGKKVKYQIACGAFIAVPMEPGHHTVEMKYTPRGLYLGIMITIISLIIFMLGIINHKRRISKKNLAENDNNDIDQEVNI
ncbi:MAG: hypothetical protein E7258_01585 [Lachnospiraceae bacterium]|nr:hypothetical protein [Lachnospiraceae bacterium]